MKDALANFEPLTPLSFLQRAAEVHPKRTSIIFNNLRFTWADTYSRCLQLASSLRKNGILPGDVVSLLSPNVPAAYESNFGVPMCGAILNSINIRLDAQTVSYILSHSSSKLVLVDHAFASLIRDAIYLLRSNSNSESKSNQSQRPNNSNKDSIRIPAVVIIGRGEEDDASDPGGELSEEFGSKIVYYEDFLTRGDSDFHWMRPVDENQDLSLNYTSGTTSRPKGVVYTHRGAYLSALGNALEWPMPKASVYLWTLPMFHCNGWCFPWTVAAVFGTNVCIRQVTSKSIFSSITRYHVSHFCCAPVVLNFIVNSTQGEIHSYLSQRAESASNGAKHVVHVMTAGAAPPPTILTRMDELGFSVTHTYGLTETYGPCTISEWKEEQWRGLSAEESAKLKARQGVGYITLGELEVMNSRTMVPVPKDGLTIGEVMMRGNMVMKHYHANVHATQSSFENGWFHSGDLAVKHPDGYIEIKDRSKDIIISGGENISSIAVEAVLYCHVAVLEAAVVAMPDSQWGEVVCAFVTLKDGHSATCDDIIYFCRQNLPRYMVPRVVVFQTLPKTATGKIQKFVLRQTAQDLAQQKKMKSRL